MSGLYEGEVIKIFPETDVKAYKNWINDEGYVCYVFYDHIRVGKRVSDRHKFNEAKLGALISSKRNAKGFTRYKLGLMVHAHENTVFDWEVGRRKPKNETMIKLQKVLDISEEELNRCRR